MLGIKFVGIRNEKELSKIKEELGFETTRDALRQVLKDFSDVKRMGEEEEYSVGLTD